MLAAQLSPAAAALHAALPQTQCQRCGYPDCASYAQAMAHDGTPINQCPPGGEVGVARLAALTGQPIIPINQEFGREQERTVAYIDEAWCIGCTLCIKACPADAIVGTNKQMHSIIEADCTGCELCIPACPVDCIEIEIATPGLTGWAAWGQREAAEALNRYEIRSKRANKDVDLGAKTLEKQLTNKLQALNDHPETVSRITDPAELEKKRQYVSVALAKARQQRS